MERGPVSLPIAEFGFPGPLRDRLVAAILDGTKTSTTTLLREYADEPLPAPGDRAVVVDSAGEPVGTIETIEVRVLRLGDVDVAHCADEGEGDATVADWRRGHERHWHGAEHRAYLGDPAFTVDDDTMIVAERFRLVGR